MVQIRLNETTVKGYITKVRRTVGWLFKLSKVGVIDRPHLHHSGDFSGCIYCPELSTLLWHSLTKIVRAYIKDWRTCLTRCSCQNGFCSDNIANRRIAHSWCLRSVHFIAAVSSDHRHVYLANIALLVHTLPDSYSIGCTCIVPVDGSQKSSICTV